MKEKNNNLKGIRKERGLTVKEVVDGTGIPMRTYQNYEYMEREIGAGALQKLADFYGVSTDYLLGRPGAEPPKDPVDNLMTVDEMEADLMKRWIGLKPEARRAFLQVLRDIVHADDERKQAAEKRKSFIFEMNSIHKVSAGTGFDLNDGDIWESIEVVDTPEARKADFSVEIDGDSMEPKFHDGDTVYVKSINAVDVGDIGIFMLNGEGYIKKFGGDRLISLNPNYDDILLHEYDEFRCCGRVIGIAELF